MSETMDTIGFIIAFGMVCYGLGYLRCMKASTDNPAAGNVERVKHCIAALRRKFR